LYEKIPNPKNAARMHFSTLKTALKIDHKMQKTRKIANILETAGNIAKSSKFHSQALP